jgi:predicted kinase
MIHLIIGNTGSGKTTYANNLKETSKAVIFSTDTWNKTLFFPDKKAEDGLDWFLERIDRSEDIMMDLIHQLENAGTDSILDLGFSKISHRQKFRDFADKHGFKTKTHFLDVPKDVRYERVLKRNSEKGNTFEFEVSKADFDFMETWFEQPNNVEIKDGLTLRN